MTGTAACDWLEDAPHENGGYYNKCMVPQCRADFIGHKRRHVCRRCYMSAKAVYDRMTPEERVAHDRKIREEIEQFMRENAHCPSVGATKDDHDN
jgi:hypothetical protein